MSSDITCTNPACREPWDAYGVTQAFHHDQGDMTQQEARLFRAGKGCPSCHFGYGTSVPLEEAITKAKQRPSFEWPETIPGPGQLEALDDFLDSMMEGEDTDEWLEEFDY